MRKKRSSLLMVVLLIFAEVAVIALLISSEYARESTIEEADWISATLGEQTSLVLQQRADAMYENTVMRWQLDDWFHQLFIPSESERQNSKGLEALGEKAFDLAESRWAAFLDMTYWCMRRIALFTIWLPIWLPAFAISAAAGLLERAVKKTDFGYASPFVFSYAWRAVVLCFIVLLMSFLCPVPMPPSVVPALLGVIAVLLGLCFGNVQKRI